VDGQYFLIQTKTKGQKQNADLVIMGLFQFASGKGMRFELKSPTMSFRVERN